MNREIKFRGKCLEDGEWVFGDLRVVGEARMISILITQPKPVTEVTWMVDPKTVGQKSGLKERPGTKDIWQGDIVKFTLVSSISGKPVVTETRTVELRRGMFGVEWGNDGHFIPLAQFAPGTIIEVIGTIHDNLELLEV